ncbi:MAG TPA: VanZ family protein [Bryobacteraceae bacterium]|nr:VanZ family protein [Bryobacteraceae bacterium]
MSRLVNVFFVVCLIVVVGGCLLPGSSPVLNAIDKLPLTDKEMHFGAYFVLSFLASFGHRNLRTAILYAIGLAVVGAAVELIQNFVPGRSPELLDEVANVTGILFGSLVGRLAATKIALS